MIRVRVRVRVRMRVRVYRVRVRVRVTVRVTIRIRVTVRVRVRVRVKVRVRVRIRVRVRVMVRVRVRVWVRVTNPNHNPNPNPNLNPNPNPYPNSRLGGISLRPGGIIFLERGLLEKWTFFSHFRGGSSANPPRIRPGPRRTAAELIYSAESAADSAAEFFIPPKIKIVGFRVGGDRTHSDSGGLNRSPPRNCSANYITEFLRRLHRYSNQNLGKFRP